VPVHSPVPNKFTDPACYITIVLRKEKVKRTGQRTVGLLIHGSETLAGSLKYSKNRPTLFLTYPYDSLWACSNCLFLMAVGQHARA